MVVCLCSYKSLRALITAAHTAGRHQLQFIYIPSDNAILDPTEWQDVIDLTPGLLSVSPHRTQVQWLPEYLAVLRPETNVRNPWFGQFAEARILDEDFYRNALQNVDAAPIIDAVNLVAQALNEMSTAITIKDKIPVRLGTALVNYMMRCEFQGTSGLIKFAYDANNRRYDGDMRYDILNYTQMSRDTAGLMASWTRKQGDDEHGQLMLTPGALQGVQPVRSLCSLPCASNTIKVCSIAFSSCFCDALLD